MDPGVNPLAKRFSEEMLVAVGPLVNVERAYHFGGGLEGWDRILGTTRTVDNGHGPETKFWGFSRVDFSLPEPVEAWFARIFLNRGQSFYKLSQVPGTTSKTWRYWDACIASMENINDWSLVKGFGHLVSLAIPANQNEARIRLNHIGLLHADINAVKQHPGLNEGARTLYLGNANAELNRIEALRRNPLMYTWGQALLVPVTWGTRVPNFFGDLSDKKLNNRGAMAVSALNKNNPKFTHQPPWYCIAEPTENHTYFENRADAIAWAKHNIAPALLQADPDNCFVQQQTIVGQNKGTPIDRAAYTVSPYVSGFKHPDFPEASTPLDETNSRELRTLGNRSRYESYDAWVTQVKKWTLAEDNEAKDVLMGLLFYKSNLGNISMLMSNDPPKKMNREATVRRILQCASRDARLHIESLVDSKEKTTVVAPPMTEVAFDALVKYLKTLS